MHVTQSRLAKVANCSTSPLYSEGFGINLDMISTFRGFRHFPIWPRLQTCASFPIYYLRIITV
jgi:hypothetical protein